MPGWGNPRGFIVALYVGEGSEREQCHLLSTHPAFSHFPPFPQVDCALSGTDSQVGGFVHILGPHRPLQWTLLSDWQFVPPLQPPEIFTAKRFEALVSPRWNPGSVGLSLFPVVVPPGLSKRESGTTPPAAWLPISAPPTSLDEFGFFNSLVVGLPYSLTSWQFWLFFFF